MKLIALDLETSGRDPQSHQILQLGALVFDTETKETLGEFERVIHHENIQGEPYALAMNADLLKQIDQGHCYNWQSALGEFYEFLWEHFPDPPMKAMVRPPPRIQPIAVGFNVNAFDIAFINANASQKHFHHRTVELGSLLMPMFGSHSPVASKDAAKLLNKDDLDHTALQDARDARDLYFHWLHFLESVKDNRLCLP